MPKNTHQPPNNIFSRPTYRQSKIQLYSENISNVLDNKTQELN